MAEFNTPEFNKNAVIGDIDCTVHADVCSKYGVKGYPTIKCVATRQLPRRAARPPVAPACASTQRPDPRGLCKAGRRAR